MALQMVTEFFLQKGTHHTVECGTAVLVALHYSQLGVFFWCCFVCCCFFVFCLGGGGGGGSFVKVDVQAYSGNGSILAADKET